MVPDGYELVEQISATQSAQVWHVRNPTSQSVVLKFSSNEARVERRFKREIEALRAAAGPHTMPVLEFDASFSWYSMPVAERTLWDSTVPVTLTDCLPVLEAVAEALRPYMRRDKSTAI